MIKSLSIILILLLGTQSFAQVVATIGDSKITLKEFQKKYEEIKKQVINPPKPEHFLEDLVRFEVGVQEARKKRLDKDPIVKERMLQEMYKALVDRAIGKKVESIKVNEKEMIAFYRKNPEVRTSHILFSFRPNATSKEIAEAKKNAESVLKDILNKKLSFESAVKAYSDDTLTKQQGGDVGFQTRTDLVPTYYEAAIKAKPGQIIRQVTRSRYGYHIIKVTGKNKYENVTRKSKIRFGVFEEKRRRIFNSYFNKLKRSYKISTNKKLISTVK